MEIYIRQAAIADLPAITDLTIEAGSQIPGFRYRYPYSRLYPWDTYYYTWLEYETYIKDTDDLWKWKAMVAETKSEDGQTMKVIAVSVWEVSVFGGKELDLEQGQLSSVQEPLASGKNRLFNPTDIAHAELTPHTGQNLEPNEPESHLSTSIPTRRDENTARDKAWKETLDDARRKYLEPNGPFNGPLSYLHLQQLHTHPDYQYNGAGTALTKWGIDLAQRHHLKIGLFASPMGEVLLRELHFTKLGRVVVQVKGETSRVVVNCMALTAPETK
jgi:hypothetical protein